MVLNAMRLYLVACVFLIGIYAVYLDQTCLTGYQLFSIAFERDLSKDITNLEYREVLKPEVQKQFAEYMNLVCPDDSLWIKIWTQWRISHKKVHKTQWNKVQDKYLAFAKLIRSLHDEPTIEELERFGDMLLNAPERPLEDLEDLSDDELLDHLNGIWQRMSPLQLEIIRCVLDMFCTVAEVLLLPAHLLE